MENLRHIPLTEIEQTLKEWGEPKFRAAQIHDWIWKKHAGSIDEMSNLSKALRENSLKSTTFPKLTSSTVSLATTALLKAACSFMTNALSKVLLFPQIKE